MGQSVILLLRSFVLRVWVLWLPYHISSKLFRQRCKHTLRLVHAVLCGCPDCLHLPGVIVSKDARRAEGILPRHSPPDLSRVHGASRDTGSIGTVSSPGRYYIGSHPDDGQSMPVSVCRSPRRVDAPRGAVVSHAATLSHTLWNSLTLYHLFSAMPWSICII